MSGVNLVLEQLFAQNTVTLANPPRTVKIKKVTLRTMKPVMDLIARTLSDLRLEADNVPSINLQDPSTILKLISKYYEEIIDLAVMFTDLSRDELLDMATDESVLVVQAVIALNKDFFTTKVLPVLQVFDPPAEK